MRAIYVNDGSIPKRPNQHHWAVPKLFGKAGTITTKSEEDGTFEFAPDDKTLVDPSLVFCNREELEIIVERNEIK